MNNTGCIYWFSGTGNSLYAAKQLSAALGDMPLVQITDEPPQAAVGGESTKIGFVFPSYCFNLPRAVRSFVERLEIKPDTYIFSVVAMGATMGIGSISALEKGLKAKGLQLSYGRGVKMPANYVMLYNPANSGSSGALLDNAEKILMAALFDQQGVTYSSVGDYSIPNLCVPGEGYPLGKYGRMRLDFLKRHRRVLYVNLLTSGKLTEHLHEIDTSAYEQHEAVVRQMAAAQGVDEQLKAQNQMLWGKLN